MRIIQIIFLGFYLSGFCQSTTSGDKFVVIQERVKDLKNDFVDIRREIFSTEEVSNMKDFFIRNATFDVTYNSIDDTIPEYRKKCINAVKEGIKELYSGKIPSNAAINDSLFNVSGTNRILDFLYNLNKLDLVIDYADVYFQGYFPNSEPSYQKITRENICQLDRSVDYSMINSTYLTVRSMVPEKIKGWTVFCVSLCNGFHSAVIAVDHTRANDIKMYWADQQRRSNYNMSNIEDFYGYKGDKFGWIELSNMNLKTDHIYDMDFFLKQEVNRYTNFYLSNVEFENRINCDKNLPIIRIFKIRKPLATNPSGRN